MAGLASADERARQMGLIVDGYGLACEERTALVDVMIAFAVHDAAEQAIETGVTPDTTDAVPLWGITWRTRAASWMLRHRRLLERAVSGPR